MKKVNQVRFNFLLAKLALMSTQSIAEEGGDVCLCGNGCVEHPLRLMEEVLGEKMARLIGAFAVEAVRDEKPKDYFSFSPAFCAPLGKVVKLIKAFEGQGFIEFE